MTATHGLDIDILINGYDLTPYFNALTVEKMAALVEVPAFGVSYMPRIAGAKDGSISADGWWDSTTTAAIDPVLNDIFGVAGSVWSSAWNGFGTRGNRAELAVGTLAGLPITGDTESAISLSGLDFKPDTGAMRAGWVARDLAARGSTSAAAAANRIDTGTVDSDGWIMQQHTTAVSGGTPTEDIALYDSADGNTFAAVAGATFTTINAIGGERKTGTDSIRQYVAFTITIGGSTPSFTTAVTFAKL